VLKLAEPYGKIKNYILMRMKSQVTDCRNLVCGGWKLRHNCEEMWAASVA